MQVEQKIPHQLAGAVIRDLAAAIGLHDRDVAWRQQVFGLAGLALREDRRMFEQPEFIGGVGVARIGECAHPRNSGFVVHPPELANDRCHRGLCRRRRHCVGVPYQPSQWLMVSIWRWKKHPSGMSSRVTSGTVRSEEHTSELQLLM